MFDKGLVHGMEKVRFSRIYSYAAFIEDGNGKKTAHTTPSGQSTNARERTFVRFCLPHLRKFVNECLKGCDTPLQTPVSYQPPRTKA